jgi:hypothetical protein
MKYLILGSLLAIIAGCSSIPRDEVISRIDNLDEKPSWATISKPTYFKDGKVYAVGFAEAEGDARVSALGRIADNNSKSEISRLVNNKIGVAFQNVEEGTGGSGLSRFVGTEKSYVNTNEIIPEKRYWEKVKVYDENEKPSIKLRMYSLTYIERTTLKKLIKRGLASEKGISKDLKQKVDNQLDRLLEE